MAALYHLLPDDATYLLAQLMLAAAFTQLLSGFLAERVHPQFGSRSACTIALLLPLLAALWSLLTAVGAGAADLRGLMLLQMLPVLLIPAGALALPGRVTTAGDWLVMLLLYVFAKLLRSRRRDRLRGHGLDQWPLADAPRAGGGCDVADLPRARRRATQLPRRFVGV